MLNQDSVFFIAEVSANHLGSLDRAHKLIDAAALSGATAVKFQTYTPDTMTLDIPEFSVIQGHELWGGRNLYSLYAEAMTPWEWHAELFSHCREVGVLPFSSPFDQSAVELLESLDAPMYKIASLESSDIALIRAVANTGKPVIVSTGATELDEIDDLFEIFSNSNSSQLTLLVCTSSYPAQPEDAHLNRIGFLKNRYHVRVGLSDHTLGVGVSVAAIAIGAEVIEKHITLNRNDGGADCAFSMEPSEFKQLVDEGNAARKSLGNSSWSIQESEKESRRLRRSLYIVQDVKPGETLTQDNIRAIRPGAGLSPKHLETVIGRKFEREYKRGTPLQFDCLASEV
ncbi:SpsE Sialic acid synthase [Candidatus Nanopelagicaceae bacterium]